MVIRKTISTLIVSMVACGVAHGVNRSANANANAEASDSVNVPNRALGDMVREAHARRMAAMEEKAQSEANHASAAAAPAPKRGGFPPVSAAVPSVAPAAQPQSDMKVALDLLMQMQAEQNRMQEERERRREEQQAERERRNQEHMQKMMEQMFAARQNVNANAAASAQSAPSEGWGTSLKNFFKAAAQAKGNQNPAAADVKERHAAAAAQSAPKPQAPKVAPQPAQQLKIKLVEDGEGFTVKINLNSQAATEICQTMAQNKAALQALVDAYLAKNPAARNRMISLQLGEGHALQAPLLDKTARKTKEEIEAGLKQATNNEALINLFIPRVIDDMVNKAMKQMQAALGDAAPAAPAQQQQQQGQDSDSGSDTDEDEPGADQQFKGGWQEFRESFVTPETARRMKAANRTADRSARGMAFFSGVVLKAFEKAVDFADGMPTMPYESEPDDEESTKPAVGKSKKNDPHADLYAKMDANNKVKPQDKKKDDKKDDKKKDGGADHKHNGQSGDKSKKA